MERHFTIETYTTTDTCGPAETRAQVPERATSSQRHGSGSQAQNSASTKSAILSSVCFGCFLIRFQSASQPPRRSCAPSRLCGLTASIGAGCRVNAKTYGWLSKLWSRFWPLGIFGYPRCYDHRDPKGDHSYEGIPYHISGPSRQTEVNE